MLGRAGWGYLIKQHQLRALVAYSALVGVLVTLAFPVIENQWALFALLLVAGLAVAPFWPSVQSYAADSLPAADTTMLLVMLSCAGVPGCGFFTWLMGYIGNTSIGLDGAFYLVPACFAVLAGLMGCDRLLFRCGEQRQEAA